MYANRDIKSFLFVPLSHLYNSDQNKNIQQSYMYIYTNVFTKINAGKLDFIGPLA